MVFPKAVYTTGIERNRGRGLFAEGCDLQVEIPVAVQFDIKCCYE